MTIADLIEKYPGYALLAFVFALWTIQSVAESFGGRR